MLVFGLDFTSAPGPRKPITFAIGELHNSTLLIRDIVALSSFTAFEAMLRQDGPWIAAFDFPFGQPRKLLTNLHCQEPKLIRAMRVYSILPNKKDGLAQTLLVDVQAPLTICLYFSY